MNLLLVADGHYYQTPNGTVYADSVFDYNFYKRYLSVFDHVFAVVRVNKIDETPIGKKKASGDGISFITLPNYKGPYEYALHYGEIIKIVNKTCKDDSFPCAIFRLPSSTANVFCKRFSKTGKPFAVEIVIDPWENFGPREEGNKLVLWWARRSWTKVVRDMCLKANGASYVTEKYLQEKYPPRASLDCNGFVGSYSSVELADNSYGEAKLWGENQKIFWLSHVANYFATKGKGHLTVINTVKIVREHGYDLRVKFIGDGPKRKEFEDYAASLGLSDYVLFLGRLPNGDEVRKTISDTDIFILPTLAEGLPRALLEAMSIGLPCLSSPVCGIPEVLESEFLFDFEDSKGFAMGVEKLIRNPRLMENISMANLQISKKYSSSILQERRASFYRKLRIICESNN